MNEVLGFTFRLPLWRVFFLQDPGWGGIMPLGEPVVRAPRGWVGSLVYHRLGKPSWSDGISKTPLELGLWSAASSPSYPLTLVFLWYIRLAVIWGSGWMGGDSQPYL